MLRMQDVIFGGAPDDAAGETEVDDTVDSGDNAEETEDDYVPPTKEEFARVQAKLKIANAEAASRRKMLDSLGVDARTGKRYDEIDDEEEQKPTTRRSVRPQDSEDDEKKADNSAAQAEVDRLSKELRSTSKRSARREAQLMTALTKNAAQVALQTAGWNGQGAGIVERMIDLGEVEVDDDGNVVGLEDQIADIKNAMPAWFKAQRSKRAKPAGSAADVDGADKGTAAATTTEDKGWLQKLEDQFQGMGE